jgi:hypothetical protein
MTNITTTTTLQGYTTGLTMTNSTTTTMLQRLYNWPDHDQQHCYHHAPTVKPEAATAVVELLMMVVMTP